MEAHRRDAGQRGRDEPAAQRMRTRLGDDDVDEPAHQRVAPAGLVPAPGTDGRGAEVQQIAPDPAADFERAAELEAPAFPLTFDLARHLTLPEELGILRRLSDFPDFVADAADAREPHRLVQFIAELAGEFQSYYTRLQKVHSDSILPQERQRIGDWRATWNWQRTAARLAWVEAIRQVLETALSLVGVSAPSEMKRTEAADENEA